MINFILGFSITLNLLFIVLTTVIIKFLKNKKDSLSFIDCIVDNEAYKDFIK